MKMKKFNKRELREAEAWWNMLSPLRKVSITDKYVLNSKEKAELHRKEKNK